MESDSSPIAQFIRRDGRRPTEIRGKELRLSELPQFGGSSVYAQGGTTVLVAVHGPSASGMQEGGGGSNYYCRDQDRCEVVIRINPTSFPAAGGAQRVIQQERRRAEMGEKYAVFVSQLCLNAVHCAFMAERFPKMCLSLDLIVLQDGGSLAAVCVNAVMAALLDSGLPCRTTIAAVCLAEVEGQLRQGKTVETKTSYWLDPTVEEEDSLFEEINDLHPSQSGTSYGPLQTVSTSVCVFANPNSGGGLVAYHQQPVKAPLTPAHGASDRTAVLELAEKACHVIFDTFRCCNVPLE
ncbi:ribosomal rRNA processing protein 41B [Angomonas deanei]|nr:ribosomal rRNA processing protein 41B [Angomonas deanei]|eukprot:EPY29928.1 ribosomal rRNA processing protein 41B [Angomonas deanei]